MTAKLTRSEAKQIVAALDLSLDIPICFACLSFVSMAIDGGDARDVAHEVAQMTPVLWDEGLAEPALAAAREGVQRGVAGADRVLADLEEHGRRSPAARAIVERLGALLCEAERRSSAVLLRARNATANGGGATELH
jgi:hypothetical protein